MGVCQIIILALYFMSFGMSIVQHGKPREGRHHFGIEFVGLVIQLSLLYFGGFFS